ncbi:hypothetical protein XA68_10081 [Ophiocordyceps unilateralis]|uniref:Sulfhydryl oxidase n=1 Tax=Ophiocordyceps unilateralis TaxID=268505 RepID=A0A2A9PR54_OPHUN|nr:hypothetical protein XA68_10081 [Ophiocordyceps unilateralis]
MANDERKKDDDAPTANQPKKLPTGVVLDKDGKPCRNCTSFAAWAAQTKQQTRSVPAGPRPDCPPDVEALGRSTWTLLHSVAASYPEKPSLAQQSDLLGFVRLFSRLYPCWVCAEDFQAYLGRHAPPVASRADFGFWLCGAHNDVNRKLGKPEFDCSKLCPGLLRIGQTAARVRSCCSGLAAPAPSKPRPSDARIRS